MKALLNRNRMRELNERDEGQQLALLSRLSLAKRFERELALCNLAIALHRSARGNRTRQVEPLALKDSTVLRRVRAPKVRTRR
jgi:hypothetical protein